MSRRSAFTLVELLVVIAIIGVLVALLLPAVQSAREAANRMSCSNNLKQLALGCHNFHDTYKKFPQGIYLSPTGAETGGAWTAELLPFIEQQSTYDKMTLGVEGANWGSSAGIANASFDSASTTDRNVAALEAKFPVFVCPSSPIDDTVADRSTDNWIVLKRTPANYLGVASGIETVDNPSTSPKFKDLDGIFSYGSKTKFASITDGSSNTLMICEAITVVMPDFTSQESASANTRKDHWAIGSDDSDVGRDPSEFLGSTGVPINRVDLELSFTSEHPGGVQGALADGSVRFLPQTIDFTVWRNVGNRKDGQVVTLP